jgi:hypothetical protein
MDSWMSKRSSRKGHAGRSILMRRKTDYVSCGRCSLLLKKRMSKAYKKNKNLIKNKKLKNKKIKK